MSLLLLKRVGYVNRTGGISTHLLIPYIDNKYLYGPMRSAILLANCWRFRRERPYVIACTDEGLDATSFDADDLKYVSQLPVLPTSGPTNGVTLRYVGQGDLSPFVPRSEEGFLLFLPTSHVAEVPSWPFLVTQLNSILLTLCDELIKIKTAYSYIDEPIEMLPESDSGVGQEKGTVRKRGRN